MMTELVEQFGHNYICMTLDSRYIFSGTIGLQFLKGEYGYEWFYNYN